MKEEEIIKLVSGHSQSDEREKLLSEIFDSPEKKEKYYKFKNLWALTSQADSTKKANVNDIRIFQNNIQKNKYIVFRWRTVSILKYAAIIVFAFFCGRLIFVKEQSNVQDKHMVYNEINVPPGQMAQATLSDGTTVYINSSSKLKYPASFSTNERRVFLSGEAFFSVSKKSAPFIVETNNNRLVKVLGTKFNLMSYPDDKLYQVTLIEGSIAMLDSFGRELTKLKPGGQYSYDIEQKHHLVKSVDTNLFASWKDGVYIFDHITLQGLCSRLERIFDVNIIIENDKISNYKFTGTISRNVPFEQILKIIQISAPIKYKLKEKNRAIEEVRLY